MTNRQLALLTALALTWGCSFLFIKVIVDAGIAPAGMAGLRTLLGAVSLTPFAWRARAGFRQPRRKWLIMVGLGLVNFAIPWTIFGIAGDHIPTGASAVANASAPLWSALLVAILLPSEPLTPARAAGLLLGFAGVLVLMGRDLADVSGGHAPYILLILAATLSYGFSSVSIRRWLPGVPPVPLATVQVATASAVLVPYAFATGGFEGADWAPRVILSIVALGGLSSGVAVVAYMYLIQSTGPVRASVVTYMIPPIGVLLGWLVLDEAVGWSLIVALAFILGGVALVQGINPRRIVARLAPSRPFPASAGD